MSMYCFKVTARFKHTFFLNVSHGKLMKLGFIYLGM